MVNFAYRMWRLQYIIETMLGSAIKMNIKKDFCYQEN